MTTKTVSIVSAMTVKETFSAAESPASGNSGNTRTYKSYNSEVSMSATTSPNPDGPVFDLSGTIAAGPTPVDFDLTAAPLASDINETADATGEKLLAIKIQAPATNAGALTIGPNGGNGYDLFNQGDGIVLQPGEECLRHYNAANSGHDAVGSSDKDIRISGTAGDTWTCIAQFGSDSA